MFLFLDTIQEFVQLLGREDLPYQCLSYDTTFDMGDFYLSVLTFRQTEFEETPVTLFETTSLKYQDFVVGFTPLETSKKSLELLESSTF